MPEPRGAFAARSQSLIAFVLFTAILCSHGAAAAPRKKALPSKPIDLNRATLVQLEELPGVGPVMAASILRIRQQSGPFERVDDLLAIRGISRRRFEKIRPYVYVGRRTAAQSSARQKSSKPPRRGSAQP